MTLGPLRAFAGNPLLLLEEILPAKQRRMRRITAERTRAVIHWQRARDESGFHISERQSERLLRAEPWIPDRRPAYAAERLRRDKKGGVRDDENGEVGPLRLGVLACKLEGRALTRN